MELETVNSGIPETAQTLPSPKGMAYCGQRKRFQVIKLQTRGTKARLHMSDLSIELQTFQRNLTDLLSKAEGKFALVVGEAIISTFETYADAVQAGYAEVGLDKPFLVKRIARVEAAAHYSRPLLQPSNQHQPACRA